MAVLEPLIAIENAAEKAVAHQKFISLISTSSDFRVPASWDISPTRSSSSRRLYSDPKRVVIIASFLWVAFDVNNCTASNHRQSACRSRKFWSVPREVVD